MKEKCSDYDKLEENVNLCGIKFTSFFFKIFVEIIMKTMSNLLSDMFRNEKRILALEEKVSVLEKIIKEIEEISDEDDSDPLAYVREVLDSESI